MDLHAYLSAAGAPSTVDLAARLEVNPDQLRQWRHGYANRKPSAEACVELERHTDGAVTCEELRPDLSWSRIPDKAWPNKKGRPVLDFAKAAA
jgi:DNA-binding transcriptional regulator YdaS (Cro superfamily)